MPANPPSPNYPAPPSLFRRFLMSFTNYAPSPARFVFSSALVWHSLAARYFIMTPFSTLRLVTAARPITFTSAEIVQYLGGLNIGYAFLALQGLFSPRREVNNRKRMALVISLANLTQVWFTLKFWKSARWSMSGMVPIFLGDAFLTLVTFLYYMQRERDRHDE